MRESLIEKKADQIAKQNGWYAIKMKSVNNNGLPDKLYIRNGVFLFVEYKAPNEKPRKLQQFVIEQLRDHGATVVVIDSLEGINNVFA